MHNFQVTCTDYIVMNCSTDSSACVHASVEAGTIKDNVLTNLEECIKLCHNFLVLISIVRRYIH